ncbi:NTE family protein [Natranaerovirga pectinivora]|uniref:NTE family protein n=1 Tax=Natranaerovirga pectinivora TaxID=682400 RepID=A0A4R3MQI0_9FIRM|nr:patatin-like phospholipase family protein [Natranaerovirga pectinivora]TCT14680.1 NTE family protein [Natranaerovirga pectinivora]
MDLKIDPSQEYGLALEGGGARGAYQIGVWKALREFNINIKGVVGTSVGALNGALICMDHFNEAVHIWENISFSQVMDVRDDIIENIKKFDFKTIDFSEVFKDLKKIMINKGLDITPLRTLISEILDEEKIRGCKKEFGLVTVCLSELKPIEVFLKDIPNGELIDYLIASAYLPIFKKEKINGKRYLDGGFHNKVPINMLIENEYKNIIVIRIFGVGVEKRVKIGSDINLVEISPREDIGSILDFQDTKCKYNMTLGYYDALRTFKGLEGDKYYINVLNSESYYIERICNLSEELKNKLLKIFNSKKSNCRGLFEDVIPNIAKRIVKVENWNYKDFFVYLLEFIASKFKIERFNEYTDQELILILKEKIEEYELKIENGNDNSLRILLLEVIKEI